jgi:hypothetical protein
VPSRPTTLIRSGALELGALAGAAIALGAYRMWALDGGALAHREDAVTLFALACVVLAVQVREQLAPDPSWRAIGVGAAGGALFALLLARILAPPFVEQPLYPWSLPGFSITLPSAMRGEPQAYGGGHVQVDTPTVHSLVMWSPGALDDADGLARMATGAFEARGSRTVKTKPLTLEVKGLPSTSIVVGGGSTKGVVTAIRCGKRVVIVQTWSDPDLAVGTLHRRIVASFRCTPVDADEQRIAHSPITIDLPDGWQIASPEGTPTAWQGPLGTIRTTEAPRVDLASLLPGLAGWLSIETGPVTFETRETLGAHAVEVGTFEQAGVRGEVLVTMVPCGERNFLLVSVGLPGAKDARAALASARCLPE